MTSEAIPILVNGRHDVQQRNHGPAGVREARDDGTFLSVQVTLELTLEQTRVERSFVCQLAVLAVRCLADGWMVRGLGWCGNSRESPGCLVWRARIKNGVPGVWRAAGLQPRLSLACTLHTAHWLSDEGGTLGLARASSGPDGLSRRHCVLLTASDWRRARLYQMEMAGCRRQPYRAALASDLMGLLHVVVVVVSRLVVAVSPCRRVAVLPCRRTVAPCRASCVRAVAVRGRGCLLGARGSTGRQGDASIQRNVFCAGKTRRSAAGGSCVCCCSLWGPARTGRRAVKRALQRRVATHMDRWTARRSRRCKMQCLVARELGAYALLHVAKRSPLAGTCARWAAGRAGHAGAPTAGTPRPWLLLDV